MQEKFLKNDEVTISIFADDAVIFSVDNHHEEVVKNLQYAFGQNPQLVQGIENKTNENQLR